MRTTVIPAQVTTIEDTIAGSLNLTQIALLLSALFVITFIYAVFPKPMMISYYKVLLFIITFAIFGGLAIRIKGKIILSWLFVLSAYYLRPRYYVFDKNDLTTRKFELFVKKAVPKAARKKVAVENKADRKVLAIGEMIQAENIFNNPNTSLSLSFKKGGLNVAVKEIN